MTSFFPEIYPDELVFSVCSRYHERMGYHTSSGSGRDMFGAPFVRVAVDLPHRLGDLCKAMPFGHSYTPDRLLEQHTLYPLYASFVSPKHAARLRKGIIATRGSVHAFAGALTIKLRSQLLRYCIECASEDRSKWEETYWHRIHNVTGVEVCPKHDVFLIDSSVPIRRASSTDVFITALLQRMPFRKMVHRPKDLPTQLMEFLQRDSPGYCSNRTFRANDQSTLTVMADCYWKKVLLRSREKSGQPNLKMLCVSIIHLIC